MPCPQCDYICGEDGMRLTDFVGRHGHLDADFARACRHIGINAALPRMNVSGHDHYAGYYNGWCCDFVAARYGRDIGEFGYAFDRPDAAMREQARGESDLALVSRSRSLLDHTSSFGGCSMGNAAVAIELSGAERRELEGLAGVAQALTAIHTDLGAIFISLET